MPKFEFRILCANSNVACPLVKKLTPFEDGYIIRDATKFDDYDHIALKNFSNNAEAIQTMENIVKKSKGQIIECTIAQL